MAVPPFQGWITWGHLSPGLRPGLFHDAPAGLKRPSLRLNSGNATTLLFLLTELARLRRGRRPVLAAKPRCNRPSSRPAGFPTRSEDAPTGTPSNRAGAPVPSPAEGRTDAR